MEKEKSVEIQQSEKLISHALKLDKSAFIIAFVRPAVGGRVGGQSACSNMCEIRRWDEKNEQISVLIRSSEMHQGSRKTDLRDEMICSTAKRHMFVSRIAFFHCNNGCNPLTTPTSAYQY